MSVSNRLRDELSAAFLAALQEGQLPWRAVWNNARPRNAVTGKDYRGVNTLNLSWVAEQRGYTDPRWCTFNQAADRGWKIRKGEKASRVEYWAMYDRKEKRTLPWAEVTALLKDHPEREADIQLRCYISSVFNAAQIDGIPALQERPATNIDAVRRQRDTLLANMDLRYREEGDRAYYSPGADMVTLPPEASFEDVYGYMCTFLHECGHATGHPSRLNRPMAGGFGTPEYAREELRAEIASAFTAQSLGIQMSDTALEEHLNLHKAYVQSWISILSEKPEELFAAIKDANAIADYLTEKGRFEELQHTEELEREDTRTEGKENHPILQPPRLQLPSGLRSGDYAENIAQFLGKVKPIEKEVVEKSTNGKVALEGRGISDQRIQELHDNWEHETNAPESQEWRDELTSDEERLVEKWDDGYEMGTAAMANDILTMAQPREEKMLVGRAAYANGDVQEFTDIQEFLKCVHEELPYRQTTGFRYEVLADDPAARKAVDDVVLDFAGEKNPAQSDEYHKRTARSAPVPPASRKARFTDEQLANARQCSALEYARSRGYDLVRKGSSYQMREHDSMVFLPDGGWFWNSRQKHGRAIEFMMEYEGMTLPEAVLQLNGIEPGRVESPVVPDYRPKEEIVRGQEIQLPERAPNMKRVFSYLANTRGIDFELLRQLAKDGRIYQNDTILQDGATVSNAVFVGMDEQKNVRAASLRGCGSASRFRKEATGSDKEYAFEIPGREGCKKLYVFESPIDAMSHATLRILGEQIAFDGSRISIGGSGKVEAILRVMEREPDVQEIHFCLDSDEAGRKIAARLKSSLLQNGVPDEQIFTDTVPFGKDWNEYLQTWRNVIDRHGEHQTTREMDEKEMDKAVCGRVHLLDAQGEVSQTYAYRSLRHFQNAVRLYQSKTAACVIETPRQLEEQQKKQERIAAFRAAKEAAAAEAQAATQGEAAVRAAEHQAAERRKEEAQLDTTRYDGELDLDKERSDKPRQSAAAAQEQPEERSSFRALAAQAKEIAAARNAERDAMRSVQSLDLAERDSS